LPNEVRLGAVGFEDGARVLHLARREAQERRLVGIATHARLPGTMPLQLSATGFMYSVKRKLVTLEWQPFGGSPAPGLPGPQPLANIIGSTRQ
jgi:hypothetical protein